MEASEIAGVCLCSVAILISIGVGVLYVVFIKRIKTNILTASIFVSIATIVDASAAIAAYAFGSAEGAVPTSIPATILGAEYFISFWCASISIMFMMALWAASHTANYVTSRTENLTFYITMSVSLVISVVVPVALEKTGYMEDGNKANVYAFDIPVLLCMLIAIAGIVFAVVISVRAKKNAQLSSSVPSKQYYIMLGLTLGIYIVGQFILVVVDFCEKDKRDEHSIYSGLVPLIDSFLPLPLWGCALYTYYKLARNAPEMRGAKRNLLMDAQSEETNSSLEEFDELE